jgi:hypothetical protein
MLATDEEIRDGGLPAGEPAADGASLLAPVRFAPGREFSVTGCRVDVSNHLELL